MKKFLILIIFAFVFFSATHSVLAGGDKVHGDEGDGSVCQNQNVVYGHPSFDGDGCQ